MLARVQAQSNVTRVHGQSSAQQVIKPQEASLEKSRRGHFLAGQFASSSVSVGTRVLRKKKGKKNKMFWVFFFFFLLGRLPSSHYYDKNYKHLRESLNHPLDDCHIFSVALPRHW